MEAELIALKPLFLIYLVSLALLCGAFSMVDIEKAFRGRFKEQKTADSVWTPFPEEKLPKPRLVHALMRDGLIIVRLIINK